MVRGPRRAPAAPVRQVEDRSDGGWPSFEVAFAGDVLKAWSLAQKRQRIRKQEAILEAEHYLECL